MKTSDQKSIPHTQSGFTLVEVLVSAVIFAGVFLLLFTLLGRVLSNSSGADQLRAASIADIRLAQFHAGLDYQEGPTFVELDGIRFQVLAATTSDEHRMLLRLTVCRESTSDTLAVIYGIRYAGTDCE